MLLNPENATWRSADYEGFSVHNDESEAKYRLNFSSEFIVDKSYVNMEGAELTPWMSLSSLVKDFFRYNAHQRFLLDHVNSTWPKLKRARVQLQNGNNAGFTKEMLELGPQLQEIRTKGLNNPGVLATLHEHYRNHFCPSAQPAREFVSKRIMEMRKFPEAVKQMVHFYKTDNLAERLMNELWSIDDQWAKLYSLFSALEIVDHLKDPKMDLTQNYTLSEKPFSLLKSFYVDCFETLARLTVIASAIEGVLVTGKPEIPTRRASLSLDDFAKVANGSKPDQLRTLPCWFLFSDVYDSKLRNGMGHHAAQYVTLTDEVHYQNQSATTLTEGKMPYIEFCLRLRKMYHAVTVASTYGQWIWHKCQNTKRIKPPKWKR